MMKDIVGREIRVGDVIAYPGRRSSSMWMNVALVRELRPGNAGEPYWSNDRHDRIIIDVPTSKTTFIDKPGPEYGTLGYTITYRWKRTYMQSVGRVVNLTGYGEAWANEKYKIGQTDYFKVGHPITDNRGFTKRPYIQVSSLEEITNALPSENRE